MRPFAFGEPAPPTTRRSLQDSPKADAALTGAQSLLVRALSPPGTPAQGVGPPHARMQACCAWVRSRFAPLHREPCWPSYGLKQGTAPKADQLHTRTFRPGGTRRGRGEHTSTIWTRPFDPLRGCKANTGGKMLRKELSGEAFVKRRLTGNEPFAKLLL